MGVARNPLPNIEKLTKHHVRGLIADTRKRSKFCLGARHVSMEISHHDSTGCAHIFCFVSIKRDRTNLTLKGVRISVRKISWCFIFLKQLLLHSIHQLISALSGKYHRNDELKFRFILKLALRLWVRALKVRNDLPSAFCSLRVSWVHTLTDHNRKLYSVVILGHTGWIVAHKNQPSSSFIGRLINGDRCSKRNDRI